MDVSDVGSKYVFSCEAKSIMISTTQDMAIVSWDDLAMRHSGMANEIWPSLESFVEERTPSLTKQ